MYVKHIFIVLRMFWMIWCLRYWIMHDSVDLTRNTQSSRSNSLASKIFPSYCKLEASAQLLQTIGEDLFAIALDQPFRFPATFTFVLRAFATLEGIGKSLYPTFSFAAVAAPYAQELLDLQVSVALWGFYKTCHEMSQSLAGLRGLWHLYA